MARLISDGGKLIMGRRTANYTYGSFEVVLPVGDEQVEMDTRIQDGYVYRPDDRELGRFDLTMVRADVRIDMNASRSDMEATLDTASRRTEGGVYYTREISGAGLGRWKPGVDYDVGDVVDVQLWDRLLELPVTEIRAVSTAEEPVGYAVQVGGQPLSDPEAMRKRVHELHTQIMTERRRAILEAQRLAEQQATDRQQTVEIRGIATTARSTANTVRDQAATLETNRNDLKAALQVNIELMWNLWQLRFAVQENVFSMREYIAGNIDGTRGAVYYNTLAQGRINDTPWMDVYIDQMQGIIDRITTN